MKLTTNGRELSDALNGIAGGADLGDIGDEHRPALAQAFTNLARCIDTQTDRELLLTASVEDGSVAAAIKIGKTVVAPPEVAPPFENPAWAQAEKEQQARQAAADDASAERFVTSWQRTHREAVE